MKFKKILGVGLLGASLLYGCNSPIETPKEVTNYEEVVKEEVNVLANKNVLIPQLENLVKLNFEKEYGEEDFSYSNLANDAKAIVEPLWGVSAPTVSNHNLLSDVSDREVLNTILDGHNVLSDSNDVYVEDSVLYGYNTLSSSIRPIVKDSFVLGHNALSGNPFNNLSKEQFSLFLELENDFVSDDPVKVINALERYSKVIPKDKMEFTKNWFRESRKDIWMDYSRVVMNLEHGYSKAVEDDKEWTIIDEELEVAAHEVDRLIYSMDLFGDTYQVSVKNSVVFGWGALNDIKGGIIEDSIIAGYSPLSNANVHIKNSYVITNEGTEYIKDKVLGNPNDYAKIPDSLEYRANYDSYDISLKNRWQ